MPTRPPSLALAGLGLQQDVLRGRGQVLGHAGLAALGAEPLTVVVRREERPEPAVHQDRVVAVVELVGSVMDRVVAGTHDRLDPAAGQAP